MGGGSDDHSRGRGRRARGRGGCSAGSWGQGGRGPGGVGRVASLVHSDDQVVEFREHVFHHAEALVRPLNLGFVEGLVKAVH